MNRVPTYIAHPLGPDGPQRVRNLELAAAWVGFLTEHTPIIPIAPWIVLARVWPESAELRALGLAIDVEAIGLCKLFIAVGPRVSEGMQIELEAALAARVPRIYLTGAQHAEGPPKKDSARAAVIEQLRVVIADL